MTHEPDLMPYIPVDVVDLSPGLTSDGFREGLQRLGKLRPELGDGAAIDIGHNVLAAIATGHPQPAQLATAAQRVLGGWTA